jgi:flagellar protein FliL
VRIADRIMASKPKPPADAAPATGDEKKVKSALPLRKILLATIGLAVVGAGGIGGYTLLFSRGERHDAAPAVKPAVFVDLPEVLVNLSNTGSDRTQYLKVKVVLELPDQMLMQQIQPVMPRLLDAFQTYLRELRPTDLDGSSGLYRLKEELTRRVNAAIAPNKVSAVLFKEIVVQ